MTFRLTQLAQLTPKLLGSGIVVAIINVIVVVVVINQPTTLAVGAA